MVDPLGLDDRPAGALLPCPRAGRPSAGEVESRARILELNVGVVEDLHRRTRRTEKGPEGFCQDFQVCFPYQGVFVWHVGNDDVIGDPNQVVFVRGGEEYRMTSPSTRGYAELIITPDLGVLSELAHVNGRPLAEHALFTRRALRTGPRVQALRTSLLHRATAGRPLDGLEAEEAVLALLRAAIQQETGHLRPVTAATARLLRRTKEVLESRMTERLRLADIARTVGVSPAYLTDLFSRFEGVSLHQYLTQLRLSRALLELPHAPDLTALALELGFSSHSHFTFAFRRAFGCTPSAFRELTRPGLCALLSRRPT
jgi:AraC-like DNA-binding protein